MPDPNESPVAVARADVRHGLGEAEALASPFASAGAFHACSTTLDSRHLTAHLSQRYRELGVPESASLQLHKIEKLGENIEEFISRHARRILTSDGDTARLKPVHERPGEEILRWRWMSLALPADLLLVAADTAGRARRVRVLDPSLRVLEPTAHLHVHATAAIPFADIWQGMSAGTLFDNIKSVPDDFSCVPEWRAWLRRAFVARRVLDYWMRYGFEALTRFLLDRPQISHALGDLRLGRLRGSSPFVETSVDGFLRWANHYLGVNQRSSERGKEPRRDGLGVELAFNRRCFNYLRSCTEDGQQRAFRELWLQMTRIRVLLYRHLVHDPARSTLDEFAERFGRLDEYMNSSVAQEVHAAMLPEPGLNIETVELRKSPGGVSKLKLFDKESRDADGRTRSEPGRGRHQIGEPGPRLTWTLHFIRDSSFKDGLRAQLRDHYSTALQLAATFRRHPELLLSIRGLDVASRELCGPLWAISAPLQSVRDESQRVSAEHPGVAPLRVTVHVGEDFRHLMSGLRAIHEPFLWGLMSRGDRIGHALALGWEPHDWCALHPEVEQPRYERMFDLAWMLDFVSRRSLHRVSGGVIESARQELQRHLQQWRNDASVSEFLAVRAVS